MMFGTPMDKPPADELSVSKITPVVYDELRALARRYLRREQPGQTLQATALVHEAFLRLKKEGVQPWSSRAHFCAIAARSMREILVEKARSRRAAKRGGSRVRVTLGDAIAAEGDESLDLLSLDEALNKLSQLDPQQTRIVELRFFGGLSIEETAEALRVSPATVKRGWTMAKAWLKRELGKDGARAT
jgi:RNA polymerase sigma factor (TIGR02999 family)